MKKYLLPKTGNFYKANLHSHSTVSDGRLSPEEMKKLYMSDGYSIIAYTDHNKFVTHNELSDSSFLALNGVEIDINDTIQPRKLGKTCHFCIIAANDKPFDNLFKNFNRVHSGECISQMMQMARYNDFFVTYNHPTWSMEGYSDYINYHGMHAMEIYNHCSLAEGHDEHNSKEYDDMLRCGKRIYCIATDDNHNNPDYPDWLGGFTVIKSENLEYEAVTDALFGGNFYASEGPLINELWYENNKVYIRFEPARKAFITKGTRNVLKVEAYEDKLITEAVFPVEDDDIYFRITVEAVDAKRAYTNAYFMDELIG